MFPIANAGSDSRRLDVNSLSKRTDGEALLMGPFSPLGATAIDFRRLLLLEVGMMLLFTSLSWCGFQLYDALTSVDTIMGR